MHNSLYLHDASTATETMFSELYKGYLCRIMHEMSGGLDV
jgi:hypothetical protein